MPDRDRAAVVWSDRLVVLHLRPGGNLERLVRGCLEAPPSVRPDVHLTLGPDLVPPQLAEPLLARGAIGWSVDEPSAAVAAKPTTPPASSPVSVPRVGMPAAEPWPYLTHWTRAPQGPWPDERREDYLDSLIWGDADTDRSAGAALLRIVRQRLLRASAQGIRGRAPMVCFTAVPLADLSRHRVFRPHRQRWDWEPYGICIARDWLIGRGARPVTYGDEADWARLAAADRPYFQRRTTRGQGRRQTDWTTEREWRLAGDLDLSGLPAEAALLFVPTAAEGSRLATFSPWPVAVLAG